MHPEDKNIVACVLCCLPTTVSSLRHGSELDRSLLAKWIPGTIRSRETGDIFQPSHRDHKHEPGFVDCFILWQWRSLNSRGTSLTTTGDSSQTWVFFKYINTLWRCVNLCMIARIVRVKFSKNRGIFPGRNRLSNDSEARHLSATPYLVTESRLQPRWGRNQTERSLSSLLQRGPCPFRNFVFRCERHSVLKYKYVGRLVS